MQSYKHAVGIATAVFERMLAAPFFAFPIASWNLCRTIGSRQQLCHGRNGDVMDSVS